eukprot:2072466-Ditylum_brightwellii.AAC.1
MATANNRFFNKREQQLKEDLESLVTTKIKSGQQELAVKFTANIMKNTMHQQQTEMKNTIQQ